MLANASRISEAAKALLSGAAGRSAGLVLLSLSLSACCIGGRDTAAFRGSADVIPLPGEEVVERGEVESPAREGEQIQTPEDPRSPVAPDVPATWIDVFSALENVIYFEFDLARLNSTAVRTLRRWVSDLRRYPEADLAIRGHTDTRGTRDYNLWLGERRARSVQDFLETRGIDSKRIRITSYGEEEPAVRGTSEGAHRLNRRAVLTVEASRDD